MKIRTILGTFLLAVAGVCFTTQSARAQTDGDLILGFEELSGTATATNVMVDLGSYSSPLSSINLNSVLTAAYGPSWSTSGEIAWSIAGTSYNTGSSLSPQVTLTSGQSENDILWISTASTSGYTPAAAAASTQTTPAGLINAEYGVVSGTGNPATVGNSGGGDYSKEENNDGAYTNPYNYFTGGNIENVGPGTANLYQLIGSGGLGTPHPAESEIGSFTLESNGEFIEVPEPSTYAMLGLGGLGLLFFARRRLARLGLVG